MTPAEWFWLQGVPVFPTCNKRPAVSKGTSQFDYRSTRDQAVNFGEYGVPLGRVGRTSEFLTVVDTDDAASEAWVARNVAQTPFKVRTPRGRHRWFRAAEPLPSFIHRDGHTIENRNKGLYVIGPGSIRPDGGRYAADDWSWRWEDIPFFPADFVFDDRPCDARGSGDAQSLVLPEGVFGGERHAMLHRVMRSLVAHGVPLEGAIETCLITNREHCRPPLEDLHELDGFLRRAFFQRDRADFVRAPKTGWVLAGALIEVGLSVEASLVAVRSITPDFDPETSA
ncbi:MAG TPA: bifunctional DNA primase/polymerase [Gemmatimonadaceae bacterium]|nr:bifunctional DNA primase/polymerase [Gemmatimonadaceae bacterium]